MTEVDLQQIGFNMDNKIDAIEWLYSKYGPMSEGQWKLKGLRYVLFKNSKHATYFCLRWS